MDYRVFWLFSIVGVGLISMGGYGFVHQSGYWGWWLFSGLCCLVGSAMVVSAMDR